MNAGRSSRGEHSPERLSVLVADGDAPQRAAVRETLAAHGLTVVGEAQDAAAAVAAATRLRPDVLLLDLRLPGDAMRAIDRIATAAPETLVVVLTTSDRPEDVVAAFAHGAAGYLLKGLSGERLASTLRAAYRGEPALPRSLVPHLVDEIRRGTVRRVALPGGAVTLTLREWQVGQLLRQGFTTAEIAERLGVSPVTVRRHVGLLLRKLGVPDRGAAVELLRAYGRG